MTQHTEEDVAKLQLLAIEKLMREEADLDPELLPYLGPGPLGQCLRHPLVYSGLYAPQMNAMLNMQLKGKQAALDEAASKDDWHSYVYLHERPYRVDAFVDVARNLNDVRYWKLLGGMYTDTENLWENKELWIDLLTVDRKHRKRLMTGEERKALRALPNNVTVYRGYADDGDADGLSWTLDRKVAQFFARRLAPRGATLNVAKAVAQRDQALAHFTGRSESELVFLPGTVMVLETEIFGIQK